MTMNIKRPRAIRVSNEEGKKIDEIQTGNVEKAIRGIEETKYNLKEISKNTEPIETNFIILYTEKLTKALENVSLVKPYIFDNQFGELSFSGTGDIRIEQNKRKENLRVYDYPIYIEFNSKEDDISIYQDISPILLTIYRKQASSIYSSEIAETIISLYAKWYNKQSLFSSLLNLLTNINEIPNLILNRAHNKMKRQENNLQDLNGNLKKLERLVIKDF